MKENEKNEKDIFSISFQKGSLSIFRKKDSKNIFLIYFKK